VDRALPHSANRSHCKPLRGKALRCNWFSR
jgi:hypothetical protein